MRNILEKIPLRNLTWLLSIWLGSMMMYHSYGALFGDMEGFIGYLKGLGFPLAVPLAYLAKGSEFFAPGTQDQGDKNGKFVGRDAIACDAGSLFAGPEEVP